MTHDRSAIRRLKARLDTLALRSMMPCLSRRKWIFESFGVEAFLRPTPGRGAITKLFQ
jgi:hypothetical protein